ncbi:bifunctional 2-polyprenyl-6-hydroxyphenol methylase/3-demethylubiquinol 3-O-methyltransferase UbiG [Microbacterium sp. p3-SID336]|uniref:class I SAM-dependent methyltransferase n=1 Tax=Microbacterium sp. p3-SID336 TaxID=2916212 RepID=UPI0021A4DDE8|nr:class I SAM-dependent methyltransferase [Microbacterium sp. p3-SID336]MCT1477250.1 class I SAM-dependent methyltransferase [Microbacterium sp. p3-SID336]
MSDVPDAGVDRGAYWNHNTAYHPWILRIAARGSTEDALDVGCGEGLLVQRLAPLFTTVTGIDPDPAAIARAQDRLRGAHRAKVALSSFADFDAADRRFDLITFVATLHHMDLRPTLAKTARLLRPGGTLAVVGLAANRSAGDWILSALAVPWVRLGSALHRESRDIGVATAAPRESLAEIRTTAETVLPGVRVRRGLYYRYLLSWTKPAVLGDAAGRDSL